MLEYNVNLLATEYFFHLKLKFEFCFQNNFLKDTNLKLPKSLFIYVFKVLFKFK